jgi:large subunit ribosomal protein L29
MKNEKENLTKLSVEQLKEKLENSRRELFSLRLTAATSHVKDNSQFRKLRKEIARILTCLRQNTAVRAS